MQLSRTMSGQTPFIMNVTVFSSTVISEGAMLVTGASTTAVGATVVVQYTDNTDGTNFIGVNQVGSSLASASVENRAPNSHAFGIPSSGIPNTGSTTTVIKNYLPLCINTDASYFALYSTTTGAGTASDPVATWSASTGAVATRGTTGVNVIGGWLFSLAGTNSAGNTPTFSGSLRYISNQTATTNVALISVMNISTDSHMIWMDHSWKKSAVFTSGGNMLRSHSGASATGYQLNGAKVIRIDNYINADHAPTHPLRFHVDDGLNGLTGVELLSELVFTAPFLQNVTTADPV